MEIWVEKGIFVIQWRQHRYRPQLISHLAHVASRAFPLFYISEIFPFHSQLRITSKVSMSRADLSEAVDL